MGRLKALVLVLLTLSTAATLSAGTLAAYNRSVNQSGTIHAAKLVFKVNDSGEATQPLGDLELRPGENKPFDIEIDTEGSEVALDVLLKVALSGPELPPGLSIDVDNTGGDTETYAMKGTSRKVLVVISWKATQEELMKLYEGSRNFKLDLFATVTASQAAK